jgi:hypothetical protein
MPEPAFAGAQRPIAESYDPVKVVDYLLKLTDSFERSPFIANTIRNAIAKGDLTAHLETNGTWTVLLEGEGIASNVGFEVLRRTD